MANEKQRAGVGLRAIRSRVKKTWYTIRSSYWFIPGLMIIGAVPLALGLAYLDAQYAVEAVTETLPPPLRWLLSTSSVSARAILQTIAGGMLSVATLSYSMTLVVLTLASSQYGLRILQLFVEDRANSLVLGTFLGSTVYCLVLLTVVGNPEQGLTVPRLSVLFAFLWALVNLGAFTFFFHHVVASIRASHVIRAIGDELRHRIASLPEETTGYEGLEDYAEALRRVEGVPHATMGVSRSGYVQVIDLEGLAGLAQERSITVRTLCRAGDWVIEGSPLATVYGPDLDEVGLEESLRQEIDACFVIGDRRTPIQDFEFGIYQLEEIALRALSPSVNDPHTAINCINELGVILAYLARAYAPSSVRIAEDGRPLVVREITDYQGLVESAFRSIRLHGAENTVVMASLLDVLAMVVRLCPKKTQREALREQGEMVARMALGAIELREDRETIERRLEVLREAVETA